MIQRPTIKNLFGIRPPIPGQEPVIIDASPEDVAIPVQPTLILNAQTETRNKLHAFATYVHATEIDFNSIWRMSREERRRVRDIALIARFQADTLEEQALIADTIITELEELDWFRSN